MGQQFGSSCAVAVVRHDDEVGTAHPGSARAIRRSRGGAMLELAIRASELKIVDVAAAWGVDQRVVRKVIDGEASLTFERIDALPVSVKLGLLRGMVGEAETESPRSMAGLERLALHVLARCGQLASTVNDVIADGVVTPEEAVEVERAALACEDAGRMVRLSVRAGR